MLIAIKKISYALFKKKPLKIIRGTSAGPDRPMAAFVDGAIADRNTPIDFQIIKIH